MLSWFQIISESNVDKSMDQIRSTMVQHEALFREQVQALHKLYNIQILAMQEIRRRICSRAHVLAFSSERVVLADDHQLHGSILEGKPLKTVYATGQACEEDSLALTLRPLLLLREFKGSNSLCTSGRELENFHTAQKKPVRNFDLEKLPEDFMGEPESDVGSNNHEIVEVKSISSQETANTIENSVVEANVSSFESESQCSKQIRLETDLRLFTQTSQQFNQNGYQPSEGKAFGGDVKKCFAHSWNSDGSTEKNKSNLESLQRDHNPKNSNNEINSSLVHDTVSCMNKSNSVYAEDTFGLNCYGCDQDQMSNDGGDVLESNSEKLLQFPHNDVKHSFCFNTCLETMSSSDKAVVTDDNEGATGKSALHEECESIAAQILLSFAPSRKMVDSESHCSQTKATNSGKSSGDCDENPSLSELSYANCSKGGVTNDSIKWTKSVRRRRTSRRPR